LKNVSYSIIGDASNLTQWQKFALQVEALNAESPLDTVYKVLFLGRHGQGYHNAAESFYGTPAWNCFWAQLSGNGTSTWQDADLTADGILQAQIAHNFWKQSYAVQKVPYLQSYYTSPLLRCLRTANITFTGLATPPYYPFVPTVKEFFREGISLHTCDRRGNKTSIHKLFSQYRFEEGFNEQDELWNGVTAETSSAQQLRSLKALNDVFVNDDHTWISVTSHSGKFRDKEEDQILVLTPFSP
jgi:broad specificity phosphatase PhoE